MNHRKNIFGVKVDHRALMDFKDYSFAQFDSFTIDKNVYQIGIDGHSNYKVMVNGKMLYHGQTASDAIETYYKFFNNK